MRKIFTLLLALAASVGTLFAADKVPFGDLYYYLNTADKTAEVTVPPSGKYSGNIVIPDKILISSVNYTVTTIGDYAFLNSGTGLTSLTIPNTIVSIGQAAIKGCEGLSALTIPSSVIYIQDEAFMWCTSLKTIEIPQNVALIGSGAFSQCTSLTEIKVAADNKYFSAKDGILFNKEQTTIVAVPGAKKGSYTIPNTVTTIGGGAFDGCINLVLITIPNSVINIGEKAFYQCKSLVRITIPDGVKLIGNYTFCYCSKMTSLTLGSGIKNVGKYAFNGCTGLESITCKAVEPPVCENVNAFQDVDTSIPLYVPENSISKYQAAEGWKLFKDNTLPLGSAIDKVNMPSETSSNKVMQNGVLYIERNGELFNLNGARVK